MTANAFSSVSLDPPLVLVCVISGTAEPRRSSGTASSPSTSSASTRSRSRASSHLASGRPGGRRSPSCRTSGGDRGRRSSNGRRRTSTAGSRASTRRAITSSSSARSSASARTLRSVRSCSTAASTRRFTTTESTRGGPARSRRLNRRSPLPEQVSKQSPRVVCISRALGAGGEVVGRTVAEELGFAYVDEEIVQRAAALVDVPIDLVANAEERKSLAGRILRELAGGMAGASIFVGGMQPPEAAVRERRLPRADPAGDPRDGGARERGHRRPRRLVRSRGQIRASCAC